MTQYMLSYKMRSRASVLPKNISFLSERVSWVIIIELVLIIALGIFYVAIVNNLALGGQRISSAQKILSQLKQENLNLELQLNNLKSPESLYSFSKNENLVDVTKVGYIDNASSYLVKK